MNKKKEVKFTGEIPQCPHCEKPSKRTYNGGIRTLAHYPPVYDESGKNINPDLNSTTEHYHCLECNKDYTINGNHINGWNY